MEPGTKKQHRNYQYTKILRCTRCQGTYFTRVAYNQYRDEPADITNGHREANVDYKATLLKCLTCDKLVVPQISYTGNDLELEIASDIEAILQAKYKAEALKE